MNKLKYFFACLILTALACNQSASDSTSTVKLKVNDLGDQITEIDIFNYEHDITGKFTSIDSVQVLDINSDMILSIVKDGQASYFHIKPGETIQLAKIGKEDPIIGVDQTKASKENEYLNAYHELAKTQSSNFRIPDLSRLEPDAFLKSISEKYHPMSELLNTIKADQSVSSKFKEAIGLRLASAKANNMLEYKQFYNHWFKKYPDLPEGFYNEAENIDLQNPAILSFGAGEYLLNSWTSKDLDFTTFESTGAYFNKLAELNENMLGSSLPAQFRSYDIIANQINFGDGLVAAEEMISTFRSKVPHKLLNQKLDEAIEPWIDLKAGLQAPDFIAMNRSGKDVKLSELKGKRVYIDVWATWCGPCIAEIPSLKSLETELHDENIEFVSVSIDKEKDKEKWEKFIQEKDLKGVQLMAYNDWSSDVATNYNIQGIPRFILIDEAGNIVSANAPRPSDPKAKKMLVKDLDF